MKKILFIGLYILILLLVGCDQNKDLEPIIKEAQLTDKEVELLSLVGVDQFAAFDIDLSQISFKRLEYIVDYYENGVFKENLSQGDVGGEGFQSSQEKERLIWSQLEIDSEHDQIWTISFAGATTTQLVTVSKDIKMKSSSQNKSISSLAFGEKIMLAAIVRNKSNALESPDKIFNQNEEVNSTLRNYDEAYILSIILHEN